MMLGLDLDMHGTQSSDQFCSPQYQSVELSVEALAERAVACISEEIFRNYSNGNALPGAIGRNQTREDLACHVEFLIGALATGTDDFFSDYIVWLTTALSSRGVPTGVLDEALSMLDAFYRGALGPESGRLISDVISSGRRAIVEADNRRWSIQDNGRVGQLSHIEVLVNFLISGDIPSAQAVAEGVWESSNDYIDIATGLFQPALYEVGELWQTNRVTVDQERLATTVSRTLLTNFYKRVPVPTTIPARSALFTTVSGNSHGIGLQIVADAFRLEGWSVQSVNEISSMNELFSKIDELKPDIVGISVSLVEQLPQLRRIVDALKGEFCGRTPTILVGGLPTNRFNHAWRWVGADAWAPDAKQATKEVE